MPLLIAACAALLAIGWQSKLQWTREDDPAGEYYVQDFTQCGDEAADQAGHDFVGMESGDEKSEAIALRHAAHFRSCMKTLGYTRGRPKPDTFPN